MNETEVAYLALVIGGMVAFGAMLFWQMLRNGDR